MWRKADRSGRNTQSLRAKDMVRNGLATHMDTETLYRIQAPSSCTPFGHPDWRPATVAILAGSVSRNAALYGQKATV